MRTFIAVPVLKPNGPNGAFYIGNAPAGITPLPETAQIHAYLDPGRVIGFEPVMPQGLVCSGCKILLDHGHSVITTLPVSGVMALLREHAGDRLA